MFGMCIYLTLSLIYQTNQKQYEKQKHTSRNYSYIRILSSCDISKHLRA
jgi:hypothetical protein